MTPSEAHDSAWQREPGHDAMQLAVMRAIGRDMPTVKFYRPGDDPDVVCQLADVSAEGMFRNKANRTFFADLEAVYRGSWDGPVGKSKEVVRCETWVLFEIKPKIYSAGAVIRQVRTLEQMAGQWASERFQPNFRCEAEAWPVVRADDPLAQTLADLWQRPVGTWDGEQLLFLAPSFELKNGKVEVQP